MTSTLPDWLDVLITNAGIAAVLCLIAWFVSMAFPRRPQLAHWLWWLALLKLATPPLMTIQMPTWLQAPTRDTWRANQPAVPHDEMQQPEQIFDSSSHAGTAHPNQPAVSAASPATTAPPTAVSWLSITLFGGIVIAAVLLLITLVRAVRFSRWLGRSAQQSSSLNDRLSTICNRVGIRAPARVQTVDAHIPPILWGWGPGATVVVPNTIADRLDEPSLDAVLLHEAAHYHRRDHWTRLAEIGLCAALWWHPLAWFIRRQIRQCEERCCDAIVANAMRGRERFYATTLVECVGLLAGARFQLAPGASGFASRAQLKRRIRMIMSGKLHPRLSRIAILSCCAVSVIALAISASAATNTDSKVEEKVATEIQPTERPRAVAPTPDGKRRRAAPDRTEPKAPKPDSELTGVERRNRIRELRGELEHRIEIRDGLIDLEPALENRRQKTDLVKGIAQAAGLANDTRERLLKLENPDAASRFEAMGDCGSTILIAKGDGIAMRFPSVEVQSIEETEKDYTINYMVTIENRGKESWDDPFDIFVVLPTNSKLLNMFDNWDFMILTNHEPLVRTERSLTLAAQSSVSMVFEVQVTKPTHDPLFTVVLSNPKGRFEDTLTISTPLNGETP